ncbi:GGDEF domain-containing protein [Actinospica robiniae]|uniref:GGDEF domain-containing protein n=1 Tax=Actinospica robiniae TaxID=304901 RepID=UPI000400C661|nr:GGDEF domain-containing protein [Actinospica robiniae]
MPEAVGDLRYPRRVAGGLFLLGAALAAALASAPLPPGRAGGRVVVYSLVGVSALFALVLLLPRPQAPDWLVYVSPALAIGLIFTCIVVADVITATNVMLLVWPILLAGCLLPQVVAWTTLALGLAGFGIVAAVLDTPYGFRLWLEVAAPLALTTAIIVTFRRRVETLSAELRAQAHRDPLTGLANRRVFEDSLQREIARNRRRGDPLSLLTADIDHFKRVNDTFGHQTGDTVLRALADLLAEHVRAGDLVARTGGEEFAILLPACDADTAYRRAQTLRETVEADSAHWITPITVSIGSATLPDDADSASALVAASDSGLYAAKSAGRNAVRCPRENRDDGS